MISKLKWLPIAGSFFVFIFALLLFVGIFISEDSADGKTDDSLTGLNVSPEVLKYKTLVERYCKENDIPDYVNYILAIMEVETGGRGNDVMQASESLNLSPNTLQPEASIKQGCKYFAQLVQSCKEKGSDVWVAVQSYNFGGGFIHFVEGKNYSFELAQAFSKEKANGAKVPYNNPIASNNGYWRYHYGNMFYVKLVQQYLLPSHFDDTTVQKIMNEALKYQGRPYLFGGSRPETSFDCSGLTQWCYGVAGIKLPRTAQQQYDAMTHLPLKDAKPGDLIFFHSTYDAGEYVTHVAIYLGNNKVYHAGDPIGYEDISKEYWQKHLIEAGRVK